MTDLQNKAIELKNLVLNFQKTGRPATSIYEEHERGMCGKELFEKISDSEWMDMAIDIASDFNGNDIMLIEVPSDFELRLTTLIEKSQFKTQLKKFLKSVSAQNARNRRAYVSYKNALDTLNLFIELAL